jgi:hypothetical protein
MPNRHYVPSGGRWPRWVDHLGAHLNEAGISMLAVLLGTQILMGIILSDYQASLFLYDLTPNQELFLAVPLLVGGLLSVYAILWEFKHRSTYWLVLRSGILLEAIGWLTYAFTIMVVAQQPAVSTSLTLGLGVLRLVRFGRTLLDEHRLHNQQLPTHLWTEPHA